MNRLFVAAALVLAAGAGGPEAAWAQSPIPSTVRQALPYHLRMGDYVRAWPGTEDGVAMGTGTPGAGAAPPGAPAPTTAAPVEGPIVGFSPTTLTVAGREEAALVDLTSARRIEVRRRTAHYKRAALIGAGLGLIAGAFLITEEVVGHPIDAWERTAWIAGLTAGGAGVGLGVARIARREVWEPLDIVTLKPRAAAMGPAVRFSWTVRF